MYIHIKKISLFFKIFVSLQLQRMPIDINLLLEKQGRMFYKKMRSQQLSNVLHHRIPIISTKKRIQKNFKREVTYRVSRVSP